MNILVIDGHPNTTSYTSALATAYAEGARSSRAAVDIIHLGKLSFDPILHDGYDTIQPLEPDLENAQKLIKKADHLVFVYPQWWGSAPALLKGFVDRVFLPGFAFKYHEKGSLWDKLLKGKTAEIWILSDSPRLWSYLVYWNSAVKWLKAATLVFSGIGPVRVRALQRVRFMSEVERKAYLEKARLAGQERGSKG